MTGIILTRFYEIGQSCLLRDDLTQDKMKYAEDNCFVINKSVPCHTENGTLCKLFDQFKDP